MDKEKIHKKIDYYEKKILEKVGIKRSQYHKGNIDNFGVHYLDFSSNKKITILIIHGYGATGITNYKLLPFLIKSFRVILVDLPGFGKSYRPNIDFKDFETTLSFFTVPLVSLVNFLKLDKFIVICHSYGSLISAHFAKLVKERIIAIFFVGAAGFTDKAFTKNETEVLVEDFSKKWKLGNSKMVELARYWIFEKKIPIFNYMSKGMRKSYVQSYFLNQDLQMDLVEKNLIIEYFQLVNEFPPCGENSLWFLVKFGGYSKSPIINIIKNNSELQAYIYYGDQDYLDFKHAKESCEQNNIARNFHILPNTKHHVFLHNPEAFLKQFFIDMQQVFRENNL